jgi:hypothetical protein
VHSARRAVAPSRVRSFDLPPVARFRLAHERDDARRRVAEDTTNFILRTKTGESVCVEKTLLSAQSSHRGTMPVFKASSNCENPHPAGRSGDLMRNYTHRLSRSAEFVSPSENALPWIGQECGSDVLAASLGESDAGAPIIAQPSGAISILNRKNGRESCRGLPNNPEKRTACTFVHKKSRWGSVWKMNCSVLP